MPLQNFKGLGELACFHCMLGCLVSGSSWCIQVSLPVTMRFTNKFQFNCINYKFSLMFSTENPSFFGEAFAVPSGTNISHQQNSCKIIFTGLVLMPNVSAIRCTLTRRFCRTTFSTARQFSSQTASDGRPDKFMFKAFSASMELGSPAFYCGIWWHIFPIYNSNSVVYLLWWNVLQCQKLLSLHDSEFC